MLIKLPVLGKERQFEIRRTVKCKKDPKCKLRPKYEWSSVNGKAIYATYRCPKHGNFSIRIGDVEERQEKLL